MTDAWEMHQAETGLNPGPVWRDRGVIIANLTARNQALEERVAELELAALNLRDNTQGAHEALAESRAEVERLRGPFRCCPHCVDDPEYHAENPKHSHDVDCITCGRESDRRAEAAEAETRALRERLTALVDEWQAACDSGSNGRHGYHCSEYGDYYADDLRAALAASPAVDATPEPTPTDECTCRGMDEKPGCTHGFPSPAAEPQAEGGAPGIGEAAVLAAALIKTGHTEQEAIERAIHLLRPAPVADPSGNTP